MYADPCMMGPLTHKPNLEASLFAQAHTVCRRHQSNINNTELMALFSTHINLDPATVVIIYSV